MTSSETAIKINNPHKSQQNYHNNCQFSTDTISFQVSKQVKSGDDISSTVNMIKSFLSKKGEKYTLQKKSNTLSEISKSQGAAVHEVMDTITLTHYNHTDRVQPLHKTANELI